jgi:phosphatidylserine synthase
MQKSLSGNRLFASNFIVPQIGAIIFLVWALAPWNPYGYYIFLRLVLCGVCGLAAASALTRNRQYFGWTLVCFAVLYNPIIPIHLNRETWFVINIITIASLSANIAISVKTTTPADLHHRGGQR